MLPLLIRRCALGLTVLELNLGWAVFGCACQRGTTTNYTSVHGTSSTVAASHQVQPGHSSSVVGLEAPVLWSTKASLVASQAGLDEHRRGAYLEAAKHFRAALVEAPGHLMARFNLSCALAKAGELSQARDELRRLLHQDLPRFRQRVLTDPDLQSLRQSEHWTDLQRNIGELEAQWRQVARLGLPVVALPTLRSVAPDPLQATRSLPEARAGVYLSQVNRFVPLAAPMDGALGLTVADDRSKVLSVRGVGALDAQGSLSSLRVESIDSFGEAGPGYAAPLVYTPTTDALWTALDFPLDAGKPTFHDSKSLLGRPVQTALRVQAHYTAFVNDQSDARARKALLRLPEQTRLLYAPIRKAPLGSDEPDRINFAGGSTFLPHGVLLYAVFERCALDGINQVLSHAMHYVSNEGLVLALADGAAGGVAVRLVGDVLMLQSGEETLLLDANNPRLSESHKLPRQLYLSPPFAASSCTLGT